MNEINIIKALSSSKMGLFAKIAKVLTPSTIFEKSLILTLNVPIPDKVKKIS